MVWCYLPGGLGGTAGVAGVAGFAGIAGVSVAGSAGIAGVAGVAGTAGTACGAVPERASGLALSVPCWFAAPCGLMRMRARSKPVGRAVGLVAGPPAANAWAAARAINEGNTARDTNFFITIPCGLGKSCATSTSLFLR